MPSVTARDVRRAFATLKRKGYPNKNESKKWDIVDRVTGDRFPPKVVLAVAKAIAEDTSYSGGGGWPTNDILEELGFQIARKQSLTFADEEAELTKLSIDLLVKVAKRHATCDPAQSERLTTYIERSAAVSALVKRLANGVCDLCTQSAPFTTITGPYLECHHITWLSRGGADSIENVAALCANCHRKMHLVDAAADVKTLTKVAERRAKKLN